MARPRIAKVRWVLGALLLSATVPLFVRDDASRAASECPPTAQFPLASVSCDLLLKHSMRIEPADSELGNVPTTASQAVAVAQGHNEGASVVEAKLVYLSSADTQSPGARLLRWAVVLAPTGGIYISGGAYYMSELRKLRPDLDLKNHPLSANDSATIDRAVAADIASQRARFTEQYHIDFIDPRTGEWVSGAEGAR